MSYKKIKGVLKSALKVHQLGYLSFGHNGRIVENLGFRKALVRDELVRCSLAEKEDGVSAHTDK